MEQFYGRLLLENDLKATDQPVSDSNDKFLITPQKVLKHAKVTKIQGMFSVNKRQIQCNRCAAFISNMRSNSLWGVFIALLVSI